MLANDTFKALLATTAAVSPSPHRINLDASLTGRGNPASGKLRQMSRLLNILTYQGHSKVTALKSGLSGVAPRTALQTCSGACTNPICCCCTVAADVDQPQWHHGASYGSKWDQDHEGVPPYKVLRAKLEVLGESWCLKLGRTANFQKHAQLKDPFGVLCLYKQRIIRSQRQPESEWGNMHE